MSPPAISDIVSQRKALGKRRPLEFSSAMQKIPWCTVFRITGLNMPNEFLICKAEEVVAVAMATDDNAADENSVKFG